MEKTLKVFNELEKTGLIRRYVIGGGIAVLFYAEPILTYDLDVFCLLPVCPRLLQAGQGVLQKEGA
ncbi:hypothetical protein M1N92_02470 [Dehalococcoidia bacterium]|nr:hypothetical protein [Dehalococcoidia bacterium]